ncbi:MAG TPA: acetate--CoA ligase family protein [Steroidobacteraceae bacterium]|nr:acetate--CoA ligase family protein [Steroidobacteraceae bacterium]
MAANPLARLLKPRTVAVIGGGAWTEAVPAAGRTIGYTGETWRVHPTRDSDGTTRYYRSVDELPAAPDAAFVSAPAAEVPAIAAALARRGAGGFVCFAAGFDETATEQGRELTRQLVANAGPVPFTGPNCYGLVNFFDRVALWPDQVVGDPLDRGVAIITQSGTLALTLMFNHRSLPIGYLLTVGNQTRLAVEDLVEVLADDPRVSAFGIYVEGLKNAERFAAAVAKARAAGKPVALVKAGRTAAAARAAATHTGALAGADAVFDAFCRDAGIARCETLSTLVETLKVFHVGGPLRGRRALVLGFSGGDMAMTLDVSRNLALDYAPLPPAMTEQLQQLLGPRVTVANPLDCHTYIWFDQAKLRALFTTLFAADYDAIAFMLDCPPAGRADTSAFDLPINEFIRASHGSATRAAMLASLPETLYEGVRSRCLAGGVVPLQGQREGLEALDLAAQVGECWRRGNTPTLTRPRVPHGTARTLAEDAGKAALAAFGLPVPRSRLVAPAQVAATATAIGFPVVVKAASPALAHKSDVGGVILNVRTPEDATAAAERLRPLSTQLLVEQMVTDGVAEVLVGMTVDPQFGQVLVLGSGGVMTELWHDSTSLLPPFTRERIAVALATLGVARLLAGFRGKPPGDVPALIEAVLAVTRFAAAHLDTLTELDVNPIIVRPLGAGVVAVDALIRLVEEP